MIIYKLNSPENKCYIGETKNDLESRWKQHITLWRKLHKRGKNYRGANVKLFCAFDKFPPDQWQKEIIESNVLTKEELDNKEIHYIEQYQAIQNGYNISKGGSGRITTILENSHKNNISKARTLWFQTEEGVAWKKVLSDKLKGNKTMGVDTKGIKRSDEFKDIVSKRMQGNTIWLGKQHLEISKQKLSATQKQRHASGTYYDYKAMAEQRKGFHQPESQKIKIAERLQKEYDFLDPTGQHIHIINLRKFCRDNGLDSGNMQNVSTGKLYSYRKWVAADTEGNPAYTKKIKDYKAMAEQRKGFHQPESQKIKTAERFQKEYDFLDPTGNHVHIINLRKFCRDNGLDSGNMQNVAAGKIYSSKKWLAADREGNPAYTKKIKDYKAMAEQRKGFHQPESQKIKVAEKLQKEYDFLDPAGNHIHLINLQKFCRENGLDQGNMQNVSTGKLKSYRKWTKFNS